MTWRQRRPSPKRQRSSASAGEADHAHGQPGSVKCSTSTIRPRYPCSVPPMTYEEAVAQHRWAVPERYNIAADCCDKHPRDKPAMVHEHFDGTVRELTWGELQDLSGRAANLLESHGVGRAARVAVVLPATPETAAVFFGTWKLAAILLSMSVLYGDDGITHRLNDSEPTVLVTDEANAPRFASHG